MSGPHLHPAPGRRWQAGSLRLRFLCAILLWVAIGIGGIWYSATRVFARHIELQYHDELYGHVRELADLVTETGDGHLRLMRPLSDPRFLEPLGGFYWQVTVDKGDTLRSGSLTRGALDDNVAHSPQVFHAVDSGPTGPAITYGFTRLTSDRRVIHYVIATDKRYLDQAIAGFTVELSVWLVVLAIALIGTGLLAIAFALRPLDRLVLAVAALRDGRGEPLQGRYPDEIAPLVSDLNAYVAENRAIIERSRVQAGNLAHSLRTPLAVITDEAETLAGDPQTRAQGNVLLQQAEAMAQQIDYQLARARSGAAARTSGRSSPLPDVIAPVLSAMGRLHRDKLFRLQLPPDFTAKVAVDPVDLAELLSILLDNAGKWARTAVTVTIDRHPAQVRLRIADDGPGMTAEQIATACAIGTRFDPAMPGSGLGLAIARDIAEGWGITLNLTCADADGAQAGGLVAELLIPA
ncbi:ATP-binding protein [Novosphingobium sp.]|uniref:sensor histidine kinase n=1 Tax=Novosphingobium sp. TaxID=1874826 RepID=UPI0038BD16EB